MLSHRLNPLDSNMNSHTLPDGLSLALHHCFSYSVMRSHQMSHLVVCYALLSTLIGAQRVWTVISYYKNLIPG